MTNTDIELFAALTESIPLTQSGMLQGIYRPDFLPSHELLSVALPTAKASPSRLTDSSASEAPNTLIEHMSYEQKVMEAEKELAAAYVPLSYSEGFPTLDGRPFWSPLIYESPVARACFELYLSLPAHSRTLFNLAEHNDLPPNVVHSELVGFYHFNYWAQRAHAFELFHTAARRRERALKATRIEDDNLLIANRLADLAEVYLGTYEDEFLEMLTPKTLLELVKVSTQLQRISVGLPMNGASPAQIATDNVEGMSLKQISQRITDRAAIPVDKLIQAASGTNETQVNNQILVNLMNDPEALALAQDLIIKMSGADPNKTFDQRHAIHADSVAKDIGVTAKRVQDISTEDVIENPPQQ